IEPREAVASKLKVGGTKNPDLGLIRSLDPDLVLANVEENLKEHVETLRGWGIPVFVQYPRTVAEGIRMVEELGAVTASEEGAGGGGGGAPRRGLASLPRGRAARRGPRAGRRLLPDLAESLHDDQPRHLRARHADALRRPEGPRGAVRG